MKFARESVRESGKEALPLLEAHWKEITHYPDIPLDPDWESYHKSEDMGILRVYSARLDSGKLVGYGVYIVRQNPHYRSSLQAVQDILFIDKGHRGGGMRFIKWCDEQLRAEGVAAVYHHIKSAHNFGPALERIGYELVDLIYARRLDK